MSKLEHTRPSMNVLANIYKSEGVKRTLSDSFFAEVNPSTHTSGRLLARAVLKVAFVVSILFLPVACQQVTLISDEDMVDATNVNINAWGGTTDVDFTIGGEEQKGGNA